MSVIEFRSLAKSYGGFEAVKPLSLVVPRGGEVPIEGLDCHTQRAEVMHHVGYLPDAPIFYDYLRGREILRFVGEMHGLEADEIDRRTDRKSTRLNSSHIP